MRPKEVSDRLQLEKIAKDHVWKVEPSCATTGEGIFEGLVRLATISYISRTLLTTPPGMALQQRQATRRRQISFPSTRLYAHVPWLPAYTRLLILMPLLYRLIAF
jgi:hypothetical protein